MRRCIVHLTVLTAAAFVFWLAGMGQSASFAESKSKLAGTWRVSITEGAGTPDLPDWYQALVTFTEQGGVVATITDSSISTGHGVWTNTRPREFLITIELLQFENGTFAGTLKASATLKLDKSGTAFTSDDYRFEFFDVNGNATGFTGVGQATGTRLAVGSTL